MHAIVPHTLCEMFFSGGNISKCLFNLDSKPVTLRKQFYQSLLGEPGGIIVFFFFFSGRMGERLATETWRTQGQLCERC